MRAPNRTLNLDELQLPEFRRVLRHMEALLARDQRFYLHPSKRWEYPWALERAALQPGMRVLDAGCGASIFPVYLADLGCRVSAIDHAPPGGLDTRVAAAVDYVRGDLTAALPWDSGIFDRVFCISVIEHLGHGRVAATLDELGRVLKPDGLLLLTTDFYENAGAKLWYEGPGTRFPVDWEFFDEDLLRRYVLNARGFCVDGEVDLAVNWPTTREVMRRFHGYPYTSIGIALRPCRSPPRGRTDRAGS